MDPLHLFAKIGREMGLTPEQAHHSIDLWTDELPTLEHEWLRIAEPRRAKIAHDYPQGLQTLLYGQPAAHGRPGVDGLADHPFTHLQLTRLEAMRDSYQALVQARKAAQRVTHPRVGSSSRDGAGSAAHLVFAAKAVGRELTKLGAFSSPPLAGLAPPAKATPVREKALTEQELREYLIIVLTHSPDPVYVALLWILFRVLGCRLSELVGLRASDVNPDRPSVVLVGKGGAARERPMHRPVLHLLLEVMGQRPPARDSSLLRSLDGVPFTRKLVDRWSTWLHKDADWAVGIPMRVHVLRHSAAHTLRAAGTDSTGAGHYLGHAGPTAMRVTSIYTGAATALTAFEDCLEMAQATFGPLKDFPVLPENDLLSAALGIDLPLPAAPGAAHDPDAARRRRVPRRVVSAATVPAGGPWSSRVPDRTRPQEVG